MVTLFEHKVKTMQKYVLGGIVVIMVLSLVTWGYTGSGDSDAEGDKPAGKVAGVTVTKRQFRDMQVKAVPYIRYEAVSSSFQKAGIIDYVMGRGWEGVQQFLGIREDEDAVQKKTWDMLALLHDAKSKQLRVSDDEVREEARSLFSSSRLEFDDAKENYTRFCAVVFGARPEVFEEMLRDALLIEKSLELELGGTPIKYAEVYQKIVDESRRARVQVAAIDPVRFQGDNVRPIGDEAIFKHYEENKHRYEMPEKVQAEYLLADVEAMAAKLPVPPEDELKAYYEENKKGQFKKDHVHREGETHSPNEPEEYKPFDEVRQEIIDKIRKSKSASKAFEWIRKADVEIGNMLETKGRECKAAVEKELAEKLDAARKEQTALKNEIETLNRKLAATPDDPALKQQLADRMAEETKKTSEISEITGQQQRPQTLIDEKRRAITGDWFETVKKTLTAQGVELTHSVTTEFGSRSLDPVWKETGKPEKQDGERKLSGWFFNAKVGDIDTGTTKTAKGYAMFRLARKVEKYDPGLIEPVRVRIIKELQEQDAEQRGMKLAAQVQQDLNGTSLHPDARASFNPSAALASVAQKHGVSFRQSDYFGQRPGAPGTEQSDLGLGEAPLANEVRRQTFSPPPPAPANPRQPQPEGPAPVEAGRVFTVAGNQMGADKKMWSYVVLVEDVVTVTPPDADAEFRNQKPMLERQKKSEARQKLVDSIVAYVGVEDDLDKGKEKTPAPPAP